MARVKMGANCWSSCPARRGAAGSLGPEYQRRAPIAITGELMDCLRLMVHIRRRVRDVGPGRRREKAQMLKRLLEARRSAVRAEIARATATRQLAAACQEQMRLVCRAEAGRERLRCQGCGALLGWIALDGESVSAQGWCIDCELKTADDELMQTIAKQFLVQKDRDDNAKRLSEVPGLIQAAREANYREEYERRFPSAAA